MSKRYPVRPYQASITVTVPWAFTRRNIAPHVFEKKDDAQAFLASLDTHKREAS